MGLCNRLTGSCLCRIGFSGNACERQICPGETPCNGVGKCQSMKYYPQNKNKGLDVVVYPPIGTEYSSDYPDIFYLFCHTFCLQTYLLVDLSMYLSIYISIYRPVWLSVCFSVCLSNRFSMKHWKMLTIKMITII